MPNYIIKFYNGHNRRLYETECLYCKKVIHKPKSLLGKPNYCDSVCSSNSKKKYIEITCALCNKTTQRTANKIRVTPSKSGLRFCSRECKNKAQRVNGGVKEILPSHYGSGRTNYRKKAIEAHGPRCVECGYSEYKEMLDVHHINKDRSDASLENLQVLCVWCHALETRKIPKHQRKQS